MGTLLFHNRTALPAFDSAGRTVQDLSEADCAQDWFVNSAT